MSMTSLLTWCAACTCCQAQDSRSEARRGRGAASRQRSARAAHAMAAVKRDDTNSAGRCVPIFSTLSFKMNGLPSSYAAKIWLVDVRERGLFGGRTWRTDGADGDGPPSERPKTP